MIARGLAILLSLNIEAVTFLLAAWLGGKKLDTLYPIKYSWVNIFLVISLIVIGMTWYMVLSSFKRMADRWDENK